MGFGWRSSSDATTELYVDKVVKLIPGALQFVIGLVLVFLTYALDLDCEEHRKFSFLVLFQALSFIFIMLLWFWCYGQDLANHVEELIHHVNHLTNQYKRFSDGMSRGSGHREITESRLHADLTHYLEYFVHVLTVRSERLYARHLGKWLVILAACLLWLIAMVVMVLGCGGLPEKLYLEVLWIVALLIPAGTVALVVFHLTFDLCRVRGYGDTFFFQCVPGAMDSRVADVVTDTYNPRYVWLLSRHCWQNVGLLNNAGLSTSLARKYCYVSSHNRPERWRDQHFPTLRSDQVERFKFTSEQFVQSGYRGDGTCTFSVLWCCLDSTGARDQSSRRNRKKWNLKDRSRRLKVGAGPENNNSNHYDDGDNDDRPRRKQRHGQNSVPSFSSLKSPASLATVAEDGYMTPNLFARKLAKEAYTPEEMADREAALEQRQREEREKKKKKKKGPTRYDGQPRNHLHVASLGPQDFPPVSQKPASERLGLFRDDTEVDYRAFYQPHDSDPNRQQREYDPLTYGVRMSVKKEMAQDVKVWRP